MKAPEDRILSNNKLKEVMEQGEQEKTLKELLVTQIFKKIA